MQTAVIGLVDLCLSNRVMLAQHNPMAAVDINADPMAMTDARKSPIKEKELEAFFAHEQLDLTATIDMGEAVRGADSVILATPTEYDPQENFFDMSAVASHVRQVLESNPRSVAVTNSTNPMGYATKLRIELGSERTIFSPIFLREARALHDKLNPNRVILGEPSDRARTFAELLLVVAAEETVPVPLTTPDEAGAINISANTTSRCEWCSSTNPTARPW